MSNTIKFFTLAFSDGLNVLVGLLFLPYLARAMSVAEYGSYGQTIMIVSLFQGIFIFGLSKVIFTFLADKSHKQGTSFYSNLFIVVISGLIASLITMVASPFFGQQFDNQEIVALLKIYCWVLPFLLASSSLNATLIFFGEVRPSATISVICNLLKVLLVVISIQVYNSLFLVFLSILITEPIRVLLLYRHIPAHIKMSKKISISNAMSQIALGWPLAIASIIGVIFYSIDGYMVSYLLDVESFAIYRNGAIQIPFIASIYGAIASILLPDITKYFQKKDFISIIKLKRKVITNTAMLTFPPIIFCIVFSKPLIVIYLSEKYIASYPIFMIYSLILLARLTSYDDLFIASNNNHKIPILYLVALVLNVILNYFLIQSMGSIGAAISSVISFYILVALLLKTGVKFINARILELFEIKKLILALLLCLFLAGVLFSVSSYLFFNQSTLLLVLLFYVGISYHLLIKLKFVSKDVMVPLFNKIGNSRISQKIKSIYL